MKRTPGETTRMSAMAGLPTKTDSTGWSNRRMRPSPTGSVNPSPALALIVTDWARAVVTYGGVKLRQASASIHARELYAEKTLHRPLRRPLFRSGACISHPAWKSLFICWYDTFVNARDAAGGSDRIDPHSSNFFELYLTSRGDHGWRGELRLAAAVTRQ